MKTYTAQMAQRLAKNGRREWRLYVCIIPSTVATWPEHAFKGTAVPTVAQRTKALASLGYKVAQPDGIEPYWDWVESSDDPEDASGAVTLIASVPVTAAR